MADISAFVKDMERDQAIIRAAMDQRIREAWDLLEAEGEDKVDLVSESIRLMADMPEPRFRAIGLLADVGLMHMLESYGWERPDDADAFLEHLERADEIVAGWPEWKRNLLGIIRRKPGTGEHESPSGRT